MSASPWGAYGIPFTAANVAAAQRALNVLESRQRHYRDMAAQPEPRVPTPSATYDPIRCVWSDGTTDEQFYRALPVDSR